MMSRNRCSLVIWAHSHSHNLVFSALRNDGSDECDLTVVAYIGKAQSPIVLCGARGTLSFIVDADRRMHPSV